METTVTNLDKFNALIAKHGIHEVTTDISTKQEGHSNPPDTSPGTFAGIDPFGRRYLQVWVTVYPRLVSWFSIKWSMSFIVFQKYSGDTRSITSINLPYPITKIDFLEDVNNPDLSKLDRLLSGEKMRFHDVKWKDGIITDDPDNYIEIQLDTST